MYVLLIVEPNGMTGCIRRGSHPLQSLNLHQLKEHVANVRSRFHTSSKAQNHAPLFS